MREFTKLLYNLEKGRVHQELMLLESIGQKLKLTHLNLKVPV